MRKFVKETFKSDYNTFSLVLHWVDNLIRSKEYKEKFMGTSHHSRKIIVMIRDTKTVKDNLCVLVDSDSANASSPVDANVQWSHKRKVKV